MPSRSAGSLRALKMASAGRRLSSLSGAAPNAVDALLKVIDRYGEKVAFAWFPEAVPRSSSSSSSSAAATMTYTQFGAQIHLLAKGLDRSLQGAVEELPLHQQLVGVCMEPSVDAYVADVAVSLAGRVSVILNPDAAPEELAQLLRKLRPAAIAVDMHTEAKVRAAAASAAAASADGERCVIELKTSLSKLGEDKKEPPREKHGRERVVVGRVATPFSSDGSDAALLPATLMLTSGSSGVPKAATISHLAWQQRTRPPFLPKQAVLNSDDGSSSDSLNHSLNNPNW